MMLAGDDSLTTATVRPGLAQHSAPGHHDTIWSNMKTTIEAARQIKWRGGAASAHRIRGMHGEAEVRTRSLELQFSWNAGFVEARFESGSVTRSYDNRPNYGIVIPEGTEIIWAIKEKSDYRLLTVELERETLLRAHEAQHRLATEISATWDYGDPLSWHLAEAIYAECVSEAPQGLLYAETAISLLALHVARSLSDASRPVGRVRRGGLAPAALRRTCEYMAARCADDISLHEVAAVAGLSPGHFSLAFRQSAGLSPYAWLRRQRIDRCKALLRDPDLSLTMIAQIVGYANQAALAVAFKRETGLTLTEWRRMRAA